jgi:hypothetical protein
LLDFQLTLCHPDNPVWESCISLHEPSRRNKQAKNKRIETLKNNRDEKK